MDSTISKVIMVLISGFMIFVGVRALVTGEMITTRAGLTEGKMAYIFGGLLVTGGLLMIVKVLKIPCPYIHDPDGLSIHQMGMIAVVGALLGYGIFMAREGCQPAMGQQVDFSLRSLDGEQVKLSDYAGKVVFVKFFSPMPPPKCPNFKRAKAMEAALTSTFAENDDFVFLAVSTSSNARSVKAFVDKWGWEEQGWTILLDRGDAVYSRFYDDGDIIHTFPAYLVFDRQSRIIHSTAEGGAHQGEGKYQELLESLAKSSY